MGGAIAPDGLAQPFKHFCLVTLYVHLEKRDGRKVVGSEEVVAADDLDGDVFRGGVVGEIVAEGSSSLICAGRWVEGSGFIPVAKRHWKDGYVVDPGVVELANHLVSHYGERFKGEDAVCVTGHEEAVVAYVGADVEEVHRLAAGAQCVGDCTQ
jgi:hypothetical protein